MKNSESEDSELESLLSLNGEIFPMDNGYWTKFEVWKVAPNEHIPHGIRYSLTLHDQNNRRVLGYDNAHATKLKRKKYGGQRQLWDHLHNKSSIRPYVFRSPGKLLEDFWDDVESIMRTQ